MLETISVSKPRLQVSILGSRNDSFACVGYRCRMAPGFDWYLKEWLATLGKKQADIVRDLGWNKARISLMLRGKQPYDRDSLNELAAYLNLKPHEMLMHPADAMSLRQLKIAAGQIVQIPFGGMAGDEIAEKKVSSG
jgi:transcriptional regulator with XRE-family HTH domain